MDSALYISAAHKSSGKTVVSSGLCAALKAKGFEVQSFKKGPDYIDPLWLGLASGRSCYNLDFNTQTENQIISDFQFRNFDFKASDVVKIVEGNKGLHDGFSANGRDANAALAKLLGLPVILVLDVAGLGRGVAPLIQGYVDFDSEVQIRGVILNKVGNARHQSRIENCIRNYTDIKIVGAIPRDPRMYVEERHIGLIPSNEITKSGKLIANFKQVVTQYVDLDALMECSAKFVRDDNQRRISKQTDLKIAVARDEAFGMYYADDIEAFESEGAEVVFFDTLRDEKLPGGVDGLLIGGGFPEVFMSSLEKNSSMRESIRNFVENGGPTYAECGGLMYLGQSIRWKGNRADMVGALPVAVEMKDKPVGRGLVRLKETSKSPWGGLNNGKEIHAHEFHYSEMQLTGNIDGYAYQVSRGWGIDGENDGMIYKNTLASYSHLRAIEPLNWVRKFVGFVRIRKKAV